MITVEVKEEIIGKHEQGTQVTSIARFYKKSTSTISTVLKETEELRGLDVAKGVENITATATYSGRCRKVAFGVDKREATSRLYFDRELESTDSSDYVSDNESCPTQ
jgi:hypothetical protein